MSTILKALKKAQQERELLEIPKLDARALPARSRRALWPWLIGGTLLTNAVVLALVFWLYGEPTPATTVADAGEGPTSAPQTTESPAPEPSPETAEAAPAPVANADPSPAPVQTAVAAGRPPEEPVTDEGAARETPTPMPEETANAVMESAPQAAVVPTRDPEEAATPQWESAASSGPAEAPAAVEDKAKSPAAGERAAVTPAALELPSETPRPQQPANGGEKPPAAAPTAPAVASAAPADIPPAKPIERLAALASPGQAAVPQEPRATAAPGQANGTLPELESEVEVAALPKHAVPDTPPEPTPEAAPDPYAALPVLRQLPRETRRSLPQLAISIHVYDGDPRWRFVRINKKKYREGDQVAKDLTLEAITPGGLVMVYQGTRFLLAKP